MILKPTTYVASIGIGVIILISTIVIYNQLENYRIQSIDSNPALEITDEQIKTDFILAPTPINNEKTLNQLFFILGTVFAIIIPVLFMRVGRLNEELKLTNTILEKSTKNLKKVDKDKDEFTSMITHELRNALVPIQGYSNLLLDGTLGQLNEKQKKKVWIIYDNSLNLMNLIQNILDIHKLELRKIKLEKRDVLAKKLIDRCIANFDLSANTKDIRLVKRIHDNIVVKCDEKRALQVLNNLVNNSIKFVPEKVGKITLEVKKENSSVVFSVSDNGIGIPEKNQKNLFKKFYQVDTSQNKNPSGTGLGLAISKGIVQAHGGRIWVKSQEGRDTTFYFSIPDNGINNH